MLDVTFLAHLIRSTLQDTPFPHTQRAMSLLLGVAATESGCCNIQQYGGGPARGVWQLEPVTAQDMHNALAAQEATWHLLEHRAGVPEYRLEALEENMVYQCLLARMLFYVRDPDPLPPMHDIEECAMRWKEFYNTAAGAGSVNDYIEAYTRLIAPVWP